MGLYNMLIIVTTIVSAVVIKNVVSFKLYHGPLHQDILDPGFAPIHFPYQKYERSNEINDIVLQYQQEIGQSDNFQNAKKKKDNFACPFPWGKFPDPDDCSYHYLCLSENAKKIKCLPGKLFDKISLKCVEKSKAVCENEIITSSTTPNKRTSKTTKSSTSSAVTEKITQKTDTFGSTKQATSTENIIVSTSSPSETTATPNIISKISSDGTPSDETRTSEVEEISTKEQYSTATDISTEITDTSSITESSSSTEISKRTSEADITITEERETTLGKGSSPPVEETTQLLTSIATSVDETTVDSSATEDSTTIGTMSTKSERVFECPENKGKFPHDSECDYYYVCKSGKSTFRKCPSGMKFDRTLRQCYDEKQVDCD